MLREAFGCRELVVERLSGGLHGRCYRVRAEAIDYAVRMPAPDRNDHRLDAGAEQRVLARLGAAGLAPAVVPLDPRLGLVATRYLTEARSWTAEDARLPANVDRLARRLRTLHALELELAPYAGAQAAAGYLARARERDALTREQRAWAEELERLAGELERPLRGSTPCHNDLVASNVLDDGSLRFVDLEYAAAGSPLLDLAGYAGLNDLGPAGRSQLVEAYYGRTPLIDAGDLDAAIRFVRLLAFFWALAGTGAAKTTSPFAAFADAMAAVLR